MGVTITTFENSGTIGNGSSKYGVVIWAKDDYTKSTIENFTNSRIISSNNGESIFIKNITITNFTNNETISSDQYQGIKISDGAIIDNFTNSGTINANGNSNSDYGIFL